MKVRVVSRLPSLQESICSFYPPSFKFPKRQHFSQEKHQDDYWTFSYVFQPDTLSSLCPGTSRQEVESPDHQEEIRLLLSTGAGRYIFGTQLIHLETSQYSLAQYLQSVDKCRGHSLRRIRRPQVQTSQDRASRSCYHGGHWDQLAEGKGTLEWIKEEGDDEYHLWPQD